MLSRRARNNSGDKGVGVSEQDRCTHMHVERSSRMSTILRKARSVSLLTAALSNADPSRCTTEDLERATCNMDHHTSRRTNSRVRSGSIGQSLGQRSSTKTRILAHRVCASEGRPHPSCAVIEATVTWTTTLLGFSIGRHWNARNSCD